MQAQLEALVKQAQVAVDRGEYQKAIKTLRMLLRAAPNEAMTHFRLGMCHAHLGQNAEARAAIDRAIALKPNEPKYYCGLAYISRREGKIAKAQKELDRALAVDPAHLGTLKMKAELLFFADDAEGACRVIEEANAAGVRSPLLDIAFGLFCANLGRASEGIGRLEAVIADPAVPDRPRATALYRLAALYDKAKRYDEAWGCYARANGLAPKRFNGPMNKAASERTIEMWTPSVMARAPRAKRSGERYVFIVGMSRSGTSLAEQILASHPKVFGAGELLEVIQIANALGLSDFPGSGHVHHPERLSQLAIEEAARHYHEMVARRAPGAFRFTDKNPFNYMHVGLIQLMFPGSKVVWCRRNAVDVCVSNYFQDFEDTIPFASDLGHLALMYRLHEQLMLHWQRVFPDVIMELHYDELVDRQEEKTRELLAFAGLPWDERCLRFYESDRITLTASNDQVRKPLYKSTGRYAPYEKYLGQLRKDLGLPPAAP